VLYAADDLGNLYTKESDDGLRVGCKYILFLKFHHSLHLLGLRLGDSVKVLGFKNLIRSLYIRRASHVKLGVVVAVRKVLEVVVTNP